MNEDSIKWLDGLLRELELLAQEFVDKMPKPDGSQDEAPTRAFARGQVSAYQSALELIRLAKETE